MYNPDDGSQSHSNSLPQGNIPGEPGQVTMIKKEIDLLDLCYDINEETFKNKDITHKKPKDAVKQRKVNGTGKFSFTKK
jgi:hypothetical protein